MSPVEWVETTGKTIEEAKELALDQLGVDEADAEFEVLEEPKAGLFGRTRGTGRVRARVVPKAPPPKNERRRGNQKDGAGRSRRGGRTGADATGSGDAGSVAVLDEDAPKVTAAAKSAPAANRSSGRKDADRNGSKTERGTMDAAEQVQTAEQFMTGLVEAFGLSADVKAELDDEGVLRVTAVNGEELGLLVGPRLGTLDAIQEVCRNNLQRQAAGREYGKVIVDIGGVRELRRASLAAFVTEAAGKVVEDQTEAVFEVMSSADRKVVHDTVAELDGVDSGSIGEDPRRRVVIRPSSTD